MANARSDFDVVYPARDREILDGGKNSKFTRTIIEPNESPDCLNVVFSDGAVSTRGGVTKVNTAAIGSFVGDGLYVRHENSGTETMVAFAGGSAWTLNGTSFVTIGSAQSIYTPGDRIAAAEYENHLFIGASGVTAMKYNGTASGFTWHGVPVPAATVTGVASAAGGGKLASANYWYKVTYINSQVVEGDVSAQSTTFAVGTSGTVALTSLPVAPQSYGVAARKIYRASGAATTPGTFCVIATIADNTTTTYVDTMLALGTTSAPTDNGLPPKYNAIIAHKGRLFANDTANPNYVWYSEIFEPYTWKSTSFQQVGDDSADLVKGLAVFNDSVFIQAAMNCYLWYMPSTDPTAWQLIKVKAPYGSASPYGSFSYNNDLMIPALQSSKFVGFAAMNGATIDPAQTKLDHGAVGSFLQSDRIETDEIFGVVEAYVKNISAIVFKNKAYIAVTQGASTTNNRVLLFDFSLGNLARSQKATWAPLKGINAAQFAVYGGSLYFIDATATGFVRKLEQTNYDDDGVAIDSYFWTKEFSGLDGHENLQKDFRKLKLLVDLTGNFNMVVNYRVDSDTGSGNSVLVNLNSGQVTWGALTWGLSNWGGGTDQREVVIPLGQSTGKRIQFKFANQNATDQNFKIHGMNFTYNIKGRR